MYDLLADILWTFLLIDLFALGLLLILFINARVNLNRQLNRTRYFFNVLNISRASQTSYAAAEHLGISIDEYTDYCRKKGIETPEERIEKQKRIDDEKQKQEQRILDEEAAWRAEQERLMEERRRSQEEESRERRNRLKKFGFK